MSELMTEPKKYACRIQHVDVILYIVIPNPGSGGLLWQV